MARRKSKVHKKGAARAEMNMTPLIDVTFQLIIFFLLTNSIMAEQTVRLQAPQLENPQTREMADNIKKVTINIIPAKLTGDALKMDLAAKERNPLAGSGGKFGVKVGIETFEADFLNTWAERVTQSLKDAKAANPDVEVELRADCSSYYREVQPVLQAILNAQIGKVNLVAELPKKNKP